MQFSIATQRVAQPAPGFCKRRRIENNQIILGARFLARAQELKNILLNPSCVQFIARCVLFRSRDVLGIFFNTGHFPGARARTRQRKCSLICETIQYPPFARVSGHDRVIVSLIEIEACLLPVQKIDFEPYVFDLDLRSHASGQDIRP